MIFQEVYVAVGDMYLYICVYIHTHIHTHRGFPRGSVVKNLPAMQESQETRVRSLGWEDPLEKGILTHSSIHAWRIHGQRNLWATVQRIGKSQT